MKLEQNASTTAQTGSLVAATARELSQLRERIAELEARDSLD
jgi:BMFP domain-containing protein YqiC